MKPIRLVLADDHGLRIGTSWAGPAGRRCRQEDGPGGLVAVLNCLAHISESVGGNDEEQSGHSWRYG
jgi:hypothetical protein